MSCVIIDKNLHTVYQYIFCATEGGKVWTPDTSIKATVYYEDSNVVVSGYENIDMTIKDSKTGVYQIPLTLSDFPIGSYTIKIVSIDGGDEYKTLKKFLIINNGLIGYNKHINNYIEITASFPGTDGIAVNPTNMLIYIYSANSDVAIINGASMTVKDSETGLYYYQLDISSLSNGIYNYIITAEYSTDTYILNDVIPIAFCGGQCVYELILTSETDSDDITDNTTTRNWLINFNTVNEMKFNIETRVEINSGTDVVYEDYRLDIKYNNDTNLTFSEPQTFSPYATPPTTPTGNQVSLQDLYIAFKSFKVN